MTTLTATEPALAPEVLDTTVLGSPPVAPPARPRVLLYGTGLGVAAIVMAFAAMIGIYLAERTAVLATGEAWLPEGVSMPLTPGHMAMGTLALSGVFMQWAVWAVANDDRVRAYLALGLTALLGGAYINEIAFYYSQVHAPLRSDFGLLFYGITGAHIAMTIGGLLFLGLMAFRTLGGQYSGRDKEGLIAAAIYWYATIAVLAVIWYAIFITK